MSTSIKNVLLSLAAVLSAVSLVPAVASAYDTYDYYSYDNARVNVVLDVRNTTGVYKTASDFTVVVSGNNPNVSSFPGSAGSTQVSMNSGSYSVDIQNLGSYGISRSTDCSGTINSDETRSCLITLTQNAGYNNYYNNSNVYYMNGTTCYRATNYSNDSVCYDNTDGYSNGGTYNVNGTTCYWNQSYASGATCYRGNSTNYHNGNYGTSDIYYMNGSTCYWATTYGVDSTCYRGAMTYPYNYNNGYTYTNYQTQTTPLTCAPSTQTVLTGQTASFTAYGATGPFTWTVNGRSFYAVGAQLNTVLLGTGVQTVQVSNGYQTASCTATVLAQVYNPTVPGTTYPGLPNTGYEPSTVGFALALLGALVALPLAMLMAYPHAKKTALAFLR